MTEYSSNFLVEVRGFEFYVEVDAEIDTGGSNHYGSIEPEWVDCEITDIRNPRRGRNMSKRLKDYIIQAYKDYFTEAMIYDYA